MEIFDAHHHFWNYDRERHSWITEEMSVIRRDYLPSDLEVELEGHGISAVVSVQADQTPEETRYLLSHAGRHNWIRGVVGWVDFRSPDIAASLEEYDSYAKLKGFRHIIQAEPPGFMLGAAFQKGIQELSKTRFTFDLLVYHTQLAEAFDFVARNPGLPIVLDHIGKPDIKGASIMAWAMQIKRLAAFPNVWCKVSGMVTEGNWTQWTQKDFIPYLDVISEAFGTERIMYGSDWPVCLLASSYGDQLNIVKQYFASFSGAEQERVFSRNAVSFYHL